MPSHNVRIVRSTDANPVMTIQVEEGTNLQEIFSLLYGDTGEQSSQFAVRHNGEAVANDQLASRTTTGQEGEQVAIAPRGLKGA